MPITLIKINSLHKVTNTGENEKITVRSPGQS